MPHRFDGDAAVRFVSDGAAHIEGDPVGAELQFVAVGAYQLEEALKAAHRLKARGCGITLTALWKRKRRGWGKGVCIRVDLGGRRNNKKKNIRKPKPI